MGLCGLHRFRGKAMLLGNWVKESQHSHKYGYAVVDALAVYAFDELAPQRWLYPVAKAKAALKTDSTFGGEGHCCGTTT